MTLDPRRPFEPEIEARASAIMRRPYARVITGDDDRGYLIHVPDLPGCMTAGATAEEALAALPEAMLLWIGSELEDGREIPEPSPIRIPLAS